MSSVETVESIYTVAPDDTVAAVDEGFRVFARQNGAPDLPERVVGTAVWSHIADDETRRIYEALFSRARETGRTVTIPFRCDAPWLRRLMGIEIAPLLAVPASGGLSGALQVRAYVLTEHPRAPLPGDLFAPESAQPRGAPSAAESSPPLRMCSWCKRVESGGWREAEQVLEERRALAHGPIPPVIQALCPDCARYLRDVS